MITAHLFAKGTEEWPKRCPFFGATEFAHALRAIAEQIDNGSILPQSVEVSSLATIEGFTETTIALKVVEQTK